MFDALHIIAHAGDEGIDMVGWIMTPAQLAQVANHIRTRLVFLNVCRSLFLPQYLIDQHIPAVLAHTRMDGVLDRDALQLASFYYQELIRQNGDFRKAYEEVSPRDGSLSWSSNGSYFGVYEPIIDRLGSLEIGSKLQTKWLIGLTVSIGVEMFVLIADVFMRLTR